MEKNQELEMARKIKELRQARGMTLEQVAKLVGVGKSTVRKWETGMIANMKRDKIALLAKALQVSPTYLMGWTEESSSSLTIFSESPALDEDEKILLDSFRKVPKDKRKMVIQMIQIALSTNE